MKTARTAIIILGLMFILSPCLTVVWHSEPSPAVLAQSAVLVYSPGGHGSGVIIDKRIILTAKHVAEHEDLKIRCADGTEYNVISVVCDPNVDAALLTVDADIKSPPACLSEAELAAADLVMAIGTPPDMNALNCILFGRVIHTPLQTHFWRLALLCDFHVQRGCSGGPVFHKGKLMGICVGMSGSLAVVLPISELNRILSDANLSNAKQ